MTEHGRAVAIEQHILGSELDADVLAGDTVLTVRNPADFSERGGQLVLGDETIAFSAVDKDTGELTLDDPLADPHDESDRVDVVTSQGTRGRRHWAHCYLDDDPEDVVIARVEHDLLPLIRRGLRSGDQPSVELAQRGAGQLWVVNVLGDEPGLTGATLDIPDVDLLGIHFGADGSASFGGTDSVAGLVTIAAGIVRALSLFLNPVDSTKPALDVWDEDGFGPEALIRIRNQDGDPAVEVDVAGGFHFLLSQINLGEGNEALLSDSVLRMVARLDPGFGLADTGAFYVKSSGGTTHAFFENEDGTAFDLCHP